MSHAQSSTMIDLRFQVEKAEADRFAMVPQLAFKLRISQDDPEDELSRDYLYGAYQQKADLLEQMSERGENHQ